MSRMLARTLLLAMIFPLAAARGGAPSRAGEFPGDHELARFDLRIRWKAQVPLLKNREQISSLLLNGGLLFAASNQGLMHCLDASNGAVLWTASVPGARGQVYPPSVAKDSVFVASQNKLLHLSKAQGRVLWEEKLPALVTSGPAASADTLFVQTSDQRIYAIALKPDDFGEISKWPYRRVFNPRPIRWFYSAGGPMVNPPVVLKDRVVFATEEGIVYAATIDKGQIIYRYFTHSPLQAPLASLDRFLYVATREYNVYAMDMINGATKWKFIVGYPVYHKPLPYQEEVYVTPKGAGTFCLGNKDGELRWQNPDLERVVAVTQDHVYGFDGPRRLVMLARVDGRAIMSWPSGDFSVAAENLVDDRVFLSTPNGQVLCLHEVVNNEPRLHPQTVSTEDAATESVQPKKESKGGFFDDVLDDRDRTAAPKARPRPKAAKPKQDKPKAAKAKAQNQ